MTTSTSSPPARRSSWRRKLLFISGGLLVLLVASYFVVTSSAFFKGVILPRASKVVGGEVTVGEASISPFSQVKLRQITVKTTGAEPLVQAEEVVLRYRLFAILGGTLKVEEVTVSSPVVNIVENADGSSNLDPLTKKEAKAALEPASKPTATKPPQIDLKNFALKNATIRRTRIRQDGGREVAELTGVNITLDQLKNGQPGKLTTAASIKMTGPTNDLIEAKSTGQIEFSLGADLMPTTLKAKVEQEVLRAEGSRRDLAGIRTLLTGDITPTEVKELSHRFQRGEQVLGEIKITGPLDLAKKEGRLQLAVASIDRQALNLVGAPLGLDFGTTTLNSTTDVTLAQGGSVITANTRFNAVQFSVTQHGQTTPPLDLQLACAVTLNTASESAQVQSYTLHGPHLKKPLLRGSLSQPMTLAWGKNAAAAGDSALDLTVTDFDLAAWKPFVGEAVSAGRLAARINLVSEQGGQRLKLGVSSRIDDLVAKFGEQPLTQATLALKLDGQVNDFKKVSLRDYRLDLTRQGQPALVVSGSASYDGTAFNLRSQIEVVMARLMGSGPATPLSAGVNLDGSFTNQVLDLRRLQLALAPTPRAPKNELNATGQFDLATPGVTKGRLQVNADTLDLTQLYDTFAGEKKAVATPTDTTPKSAPASAGNTEPEPMILPLQLTADANLGRVYLREIDIQNCQVAAKVDGGKVRLEPCRLMLSGAPASATVDLDLGVKGYTYALALRLENVPLEPIANTFSPETRGQYQGSILASAQIKGAGVTGSSLQKNLVGHTAFRFTNANVQLIGPKAKRLVVPIATLLRVPEITQSPINWLDARAEMAAGNIKLDGFAVQSAAFEARMQGVIPIAAELTNSPLNLPVEFALRRLLAEKASVLPPNTPTNSAYAMLPRFVTVKGTLGEPKSDLNELALGGLLLKSGIGIAEKIGVKVDPKTSTAIQGLGNLLTGQKPATTNAATNAATTNPPIKFNPLDLLKKKGSSRTRVGEFEVQKWV